ncbi:hypothetical protein MTYP_02874 [Methylophilaceae bacterium]|nr:hypothetical protein MTYP_02874 [Methylophilaceae bacterium]
MGLAMSQKDEKAVSKVSAKIWRQTIEKFDKKIEAACLRRDAYLSRVLEVELDFLDREICFVNSPDAQRFIANRLDGIGERKLVSFALRPDLVVRMNEICERKRIVRDSFLNRLLLLLAANQKTIDKLFFTGSLSPENWRTLVWSKYQHDGPFFQNTLYPLEQEIDPLWPIRLGIELTDHSELSDYTCPNTGEVIRVVQGIGEVNFLLKEGIYTTIFNDTNFAKVDMYGLNCYLPDWLLPGHEAEQKNRQMLDEIFGDM